MNSKKYTMVLLSAMLVSIAGFAQRKHSKTSRFTSYKGFIMAGYQGWHNTPEDAAGKGWGHYLQRGTFGPGNMIITCTLRAMRGIS
ncbi:hypothetical protein [Parapedobacter koreensis]|uniref:Uncharacterized protein n=1 Tax=Parapedobacter koreensis TaxID=332977 RepID=A0A1H7MHR5_9SPHI|nr:hypothetical protein [Parapedobacter koreensis]SEL10712.1 hypothetical protein SAMN05421740_103521 [Parapedobacter koreensis]